MTDEKSKELTQSSFAAQMAMLGYEPNGNPKDMVEVVRCKDCYFGEHTINLAGERCVQCTNSDLGMMGDCHTPNWFCADGERK